MSLTSVHNRQASGGYHPTSLMEVIKGGGGNQSNARTVRRRCSSGEAKPRDETVQICSRIRSPSARCLPAPAYSWTTWLQSRCGFVWFSPVYPATRVYLVLNFLWPERLTPLHSPAQLSYISRVLSERAIRRKRVTLKRSGNCTEKQAWANKPVGSFQGHVWTLFP